jgi:hypothetical protein
LVCGGQDVWKLPGNPATIRWAAEGQGDCSDAGLICVGCIVDAARKIWVDVLEVVTSPEQATCELVTEVRAVYSVWTQEMILNAFS